MMRDGSQWINAPASSTFTETILRHILCGSRDDPQSKWASVFHSDFHLGSIPFIGFFPLPYSAHSLTLFPGINIIVLGKCT